MIIALFLGQIKYLCDCVSARMGRKNFGNFMKFFMTKVIYLVLNRIGNLLAYVAALFVTNFCRLLSLSG